MISAFGVDGKPITRAELGYEVSLAFAEFFYVRTLPLFEAYWVSHRFRCGVADNVTMHSPRTTWTLRDFFIFPRVVVSWNRIRSAASYHSEEYESWGVDG